MGRRLVGTAKTASGGICESEDRADMVIIKFSEVNALWTLEAGSALLIGIW